MTELFLDWLVDTMARTEVIDLYFVNSDLVEIPQSDIEIAEAAGYDSLARNIAAEERGERRKPLGKIVL